VLCYNRYVLSSPFYPAFPPPTFSLSLMNYCHVFHLIKQTSQYHDHHQHHPSSSSSPSSSSPCTPSHAYHPLCLSQCFVIIAVVVSGAFAFRLWEQYLLYALPCHPTRFSETSHAHTTLPQVFLAYLNDQTTKRESAFAPLRLGPQRWIRIMYNTEPRAASGRDGTFVLFSSLLTL